MRVALLAVLVGCGSPRVVQHDAGITDGPRDVLYQDAAAYDGHPHDGGPIDACQIVTQWCNGDFDHIEIDGGCWQQCYDVVYPRCDPGYVEYHWTQCTADRCVCVPG